MATASPPMVGDRAPAFALRDDAGTLVRLSRFRGQRVILYFYPAAMTPGCTTQAGDFRDSLAQVTAAGACVVGVSPDSPDTLARFRERDGLTFTLLSDPDHRVAMAYGAWGQRTMYGRPVTGIIRTTFVISPYGIVELVKPNTRATGHVARLLRELAIA